MRGETFLERNATALTWSPEKLFAILSPYTCILAVVSYFFSYLCIHTSLLRGIYQASVRTSTRGKLRTVYKENFSQMISTENNSNSLIGFSIKQQNQHQNDIFRQKAGDDRFFRYRSFGNTLLLV